MASETSKSSKKPFKGVSLFSFSFILLFLFQASVHWPPDMPDDMLEDAIAIAGKALSEYEFEMQGVEVCYYLSLQRKLNNNIFYLDCEGCEEAYG